MQDRVIVKINGVIHKTDNAILFLIAGDEVWIPSQFVVFRSAKTITIPKWLARDKSLHGKSLRHLPEKINPIYGQGAIDELRFNPN